MDYHIPGVNPAYESVTSIPREQVVGALASTLYGTQEPPYLEIYSKVAQTGEPTSFKTYFPLMDRYFKISVFSPAKNQFATIFIDITMTTSRKSFRGVKKTETVLRESEHNLSEAQRITHLGNWNWEIEQNQGYYPPQTG